MSLSLFSARSREADWCDQATAQYADFQLEAGLSAAARGGRMLAGDHMVQGDNYLYHGVTMQRQKGAFGKSDASHDRPGIGAFGMTNDPRIDAAKRAPAFGRFYSIRHTNFPKVKAHYVATGAGPVYGQMLAALSLF